MRRLLVLAALVFASLATPASAVTIVWVPVGNPNNAPDTAANCLNAPADCGVVDHAYFISQYETTNAQYAEFLNAADTGGGNSLALYNTQMGTDTINGGISLVPGNAAGSKYVVKAGFENKPVTYVSFYDALRFANWLQNGRGSGDTETGAYTLLGGTPLPSNGTTVARNPGAHVFLPSENEWYKAAYYSPGGVYLAYPAGSNAPTTCAFPGPTPNTANCDNVVGAVTDTGAYTESASGYGTFDQGGNVWEWNEEPYVSGSDRGIRGGYWTYDASDLAASSPYDLDPTYLGSNIGFRVASLVPEPGPEWLAMTAVLSLAVWRKRTAKAL